jgi:hypothetical protein
MDPNRLLAVFLAGLGVAGLVASQPAGAAAPQNDQRAAAAALQLPANVTGTLVEATKEPDEPVSCGSPDESVWYQFTAPAGGRIVALLDAAGDLDAVIDIYRRARSTLQPVDCSPTDEDGRATLEEEFLRTGSTYLVRVAAQTGSAPDRFNLRILVPSPPARPPGRRLPARGATGSVSRLVNVSDAWWVRLRAGTTYRVNLDPRRTTCVGLDIYGPGTTSFSDSSPMRSLRCGGYELLTPPPGRGGRYYLVARAARGDRNRQRYHVHVARARRDDTAPGIFLGNHARVRGTLQAGRIDVVDLYRFDVVRRSGLFLRLATEGDMRMILLSDRGKRIEIGTGLIRRGVPAGRYFVAVRSDSDRRLAYTLTRVSRTITRSRLAINGVRHAQSRPGAAVSLGLSVTPAESGPVRIDIERFDPLAGWQFLTRIRSRASGGRATVSFVPPDEGRYRARGLFLRTHTATASETNVATLLVAGPLHE